MKKITLLLLLLMFSIVGKAQCIGGSQYPEDPITSNNYGTPQFIDDSWFGPCNFAGEFAVITGLQIGENYVFDSDLPVYLTVTSSDNTTVIAEGFSPLTVTGISESEINLHMHTDSSDCGEDTECKAVTVQCESCVLDIPENDNLCDATALDLDTPSSGGAYTNLGSTIETGELYGSCWLEEEVSNSVWFSFVAPASGNVRISTVFEDGTLSDTQLALYEVGDCSDFSTLNELACDEDDDNDLDENAGFLSIIQHLGLTPGVTYYIQVDGYNGEMGTFDIGVFDIGEAELPGCVEDVIPVDGAIVDANVNFDLSWTAPTTGGTVEGYVIYVGETVDDLQVFDEVPAGTTVFEDVYIDEYDYTLYWQVVAYNTFGEAVGCSVFSITTAPQPTDTPDFVNLQWPPSITVSAGNSETVYGRVYEPGLTDTTSGQAAGILAWVGISPEGENTNPNTWTTWIPATFNVEQGNDDEYQAQIGAALAPGTYYYATRFTLNGGPNVYGGINATDPETGGNFWDGVGFISGVLTVTPPPVPVNDECSGAIALTPGGNFNAFPLATSNLGATGDSLTIPLCQNNIASNVWYSVEVPDSGSITIETQVITGSGFTDSAIAAYSGDCSGGLTYIKCDDDGGPTGVNNLMSILSLTAQPNSTIYISVWRYGAGTGVNGAFTISAYDASLSNENFNFENLKLYPNPTKNILNVSFGQEISNVEIYNLVGQRVATKSLNANEGQVDMSSLASGAYFVKVTSNNMTKTVKIIKE